MPPDTTPEKNSRTTVAAAATSASKVQNVLRISDACLHVAEHLDSIRCAILPTDENVNISKTKRNEICRDLVLLVVSLTNAHELGYASTGKLSPMKQNKKAYKKVKRDEKLELRKEQRKKKKAVAKPTAIQGLKLFNVFAAAALSEATDSESDGDKDASPTGTAVVTSGSLGDAVRQTRSGSFGIMLKLPPLSPGYDIYSPKEAIDFVVKEVDMQSEMRAKRQQGLQARISELKKMKDFMAETKLIPCTADNLNRMVRDFKKTNVYPVEWDMRGPRPAMELGDITAAMVRRCEKHNCSTFGIKDIKEVLIEFARKNNPLASDSALAASKGVLDTFKTAIATRSGLIFVKNAMDRNLGRERAALSIRSSTSMVHVVSNAELIIGPGGIPIPDDAPEGVVWLRDAVSKAHGGVVVTAIHAALKINTDDSKTFCYLNTNATKEDEDEVRLALAKHKKMRGQYSFHRKSQAGGNRFNGIFFRSTVTISGGGYLAPIVLCVDGFTEKEIPKDLNPEGFVVLEVPGLCIGGDTDARNGNIGYVVLLRDEKGVMAAYFEWYDINIREPFVDTLRVSVCGMDPRLIERPPSNLQASLTHDGGTEQATANVKESRLAVHAAKRNRCLKVAANASLIQQEADVANGFRSMKSKMKFLNLSDVTTNVVEVNLKAVLKVAKQKTGAGAKGLSLPRSTEKNLIEGVKRMPTVYTSAFPSDGIRAAFVATGRTDEKYQTFPDGKVMLETIQRPVDPEEYVMVDRSFSEENLEVFNRGMISEPTFDKYGFKLDATADGDAEERNFGISQERRHRWKLYDHPVVIESRKKHAERAKEKVAIARRRDDVEIVQALKLNEDAEAMAHSNAGRDPQQIEGNARRLLANALIDHFGPKAFQKKHLHAFSQVRVTEGIRRRSSYCFDRNRGNVEEVKAAVAARDAGEPFDEAQFETWIYVAWSLRNKDVIMKPPSEVDDCDDVEEDGANMPETVQATIPAPPSAPTNMTAWVEEANKCFDAVDFAAPNEEMVHRCEFLLPIVGGRFLERKNGSLPTNKQTHWTMKFVADNLERVTRLSLLAGHIVPNLAEADAELSCLMLPLDESKLNDALSTTFKKRQGVYAHWNRVKKCWARSGRVGGDKRKRNFGVRGGEHRTGSMHSDPDSIDSLFYLLYADENIDIHADIRKAGGKFQDLLMHVIWALSSYGFDNVGKEEGGLFHWDDEVLEGLRQSKAFKNNMEKKKKELVIYLIEFFYSLLLSPHDNVSVNPGFEAFLCVINQGKEMWLAEYDE